MDDREFEHERRLTGMYRDALDAFREDARGIVRGEVAAARPRPDELEDLLRGVVGEELGRRGWSGSAVGLPWSAAGLAATMVIAVLVVVWGIAEVAGWGGSLPESAGGAVAGRGMPGPAADSSGETGRAATEVLPGPPSPVDLAARYDSLFAARDPRLGGVLVAIPAPRRAAALDGWTEGGDSEAVHDYLVQLALRGLVDSVLDVDGAILRGPPCRGETCGALVEHWRVHRADPRYPPFGSDPAADTAGLARVERILVLRHAGIVE